MFIAKCIQDGRRVDLPLSNPFFKLMCTPTWRGVAQNGQKGSVGGVVGSPSPSPPILESQSTPDLLRDNDDEQGSNQSCSNEREGSGVLGGGGGGGGEGGESGEQRQQQQHGEMGLKEAELMLSAHADEISKDGSPKDDVTPISEGEASWFEGILKREDLKIVSPYRSQFLQQLQLLVKQREKIQDDDQLSSLEKERQLAALALSGPEENIPGARLEDLWYGERERERERELSVYSFQLEFRFRAFFQSFHVFVSPPEARRCLHCELSCTRQHPVQTLKPSCVDPLTL